MLSGVKEDGSEDGTQLRKRQSTKTARVFSLDLEVEFTSLHVVSNGV
jgi:hypothetical protein